MREKRQEEKQKNKNKPLSSQLVYLPTLYVTLLTLSYHFALGPKVPFPGVHPIGSTTPLVQCVSLGALGCRSLYALPLTVKKPALFLPL